MSNKQVEVIIAGTLSDCEKAKTDRIYANLISAKLSGLKLTKKQRLQVIKSIKQKI